MPKSQVRRAVADYLDPSTSGVVITYLSKVYQALPKIQNEADLFSLQPPGQGLGAVIYLFISHQQETRISVPAIWGQKQRNYDVDMLCIFKSDLESAFDGQDGFDQFIDSLTARIQADPYAGDPTVIFEWGQGDLSTGSPDIVFDYYVPKTMSGGVTLFQATGRVTAVEMLTA